MMESLRLSDQEQRVYADVFAACDVENSGKVSGLKASELFLKTGLTQDVLHQVKRVDVILLTIQSIRSTTCSWSSFLFLKDILSM